MPGLGDAKSAPPARARVPVSGPKSRGRKHSAANLRNGTCGRSTHYLPSPVHSPPIPVPASRGRTRRFAQPSLITHHHNAMCGAGVTLQRGKLVAGRACWSSGRTSPGWGPRLASGRRGERRPQTAAIIGSIATLTSPCSKSRNPSLFQSGIADHGHLEAAKVLPL
jgi:hypothetical protein